MRTTIDLTEQVLERAKAKAREKGETLSDLVNDAVIAYLAQRDAPKGDQPFKLVTSGNPTSSAPSWEEVKRLLEEEEIEKFRKGS